MAMYKIFPKMQSNTVPSPYELSQSGGSAAYLAFDDNNDTQWLAANSGDYIIATIPINITTITQINISPIINASNAILKIQGSIDNDYWMDILTTSISTGSYTYNFDNLIRFGYIKFSITADDVTNIGFSEIELYGNRAVDPQNNITINQVNSIEVPEDSGYENSRQIYITPDDGVFVHSKDGKRHQVCPGVHSIKSGEEISIEDMENTNVQAQLKHMNHILDNIKGGVVGKVVDISITSDGQEVINTGIRVDGTGEHQTTILSANIYLNGQYIPAQYYTLSSNNGEMIITWSVLQGDDKLLAGDMISVQYCDTSAVSENAGYVHPETHPASMIIEDANRVFVSPEQRDRISYIQDAASILEQARMYTNDAIANLVDSSPEALDTLNELATALGNDPNFATTILNQLGNKVNVEDGKGLSTNDYTNEDKALLETIKNNVDPENDYTNEDKALVATIPELTTSIENKVDSIEGKGLSTNDYTNEDKALVATIPELTTSIENKVNAEDGKGLSTNDYTNEDKALVATIENKVDSIEGRGLSTNDYTDEDKALVATIENKVNAEDGKGLSTNDYTNEDKAIVATIPDMSTVIENLKDIAVDFKTNMASVINDKANSTLAPDSSNDEFMNVLNNLNMKDIQLSLKSKGTILDNVLPYQFIKGCAVVYNDEIHILGGSSSATSHYKWDGTSWTSVSILPYNFTIGGAVVYNNEIHILSGGGTSSATSHYKWDGTSWTSVSTIPYGFSNGGIVVYNKEIHILGGSSSTTSHYKWDGTSWTPSLIHTQYITKYIPGVKIYTDGYYSVSGGIFMTIKTYTYLSIIKNGNYLYIDLSKDKVFLISGTKLNGEPVASDGVYDLPELGYIN